MQAEEYRKFIIYLQQSLDGVEFVQRTPEQCITVSFFRKMLSSVEAILKMENNGYDACIIASHMAEGTILLNLLLDDIKRIKDYEDYNIVELLALLQIDPSYKEFLLKEIKQRNIQRFLKKNIRWQDVSDEALLNQGNYYNKWYKLEIGTLSDISKKIKFKVSQETTQALYEMYKILCAYKHYSPYVMPSQDDITNRWKIRPINISLMTAVHCLYTTLLYTNQFQNNTLDLVTLKSKYEAL